MAALSAILPLRPFVGREESTLRDIPSHKVSASPPSDPPADDPDAPPLDLDWTQARLSLPPGKEALTLRLDRDVLKWLRAQGKGLPDPHQPSAAGLV